MFLSQVYEHLSKMTLEQAKRAAGYAAAELIPPNAIVGLGSGTTAAYFIEGLALRMQKGLMLQAVVATSKPSADLARRLRMPLQDLNQVDSITMTVDGADEIDAQKRIIKGGGGAHVRERIVAFHSQEFIIAVDESKVVPTIGTKKLPVEVLPFGSRLTKAALEHLGYHGSWRMKQSHSHTPFLTENGNLIYDIQFPAPPLHPEQDQERIRHIPGVVDTGFFFNMAKCVVIGYANGKVEIRS